MPALVLGRLWAAAPPELYPYLGRAEDYAEFRVIDPGRTIQKLESWTQGSYGVVRISTRDGQEGWGQLSSFEPDITATVLHRQLARHVLGSDPAHLDTLNDRVIDANMKFPWSFVCRALAGVDTAIWDLYGKIKGQPVCRLLGGKTDPFPVYGSSMRRDISPEDEAARLVRLRDEKGYTAFKVRVGRETGHDRDAAPGRTEKLIPTVRKAVGDGIRLLADGNSCYTPPKAIDVGRRMQDSRYFFFEEPCPYWELEWTAEVTAALSMNVAGGEQDNDLAQAPHDPDECSGYRAARSLLCGRLYPRLASGQDGRAGSQTGRPTLLPSLPHHRFLAPFHGGHSERRTIR
jgi:L-alanine-DL-glutamate epimerase-like enolase superfamily enzyme